MAHLGNLERLQRLLKNTTAPVHEGALVYKEIRSLPASWQSYVDGLRANTTLIGKYDELKKALINESNYRKNAGLNKDQTSIMELLKE